MEARRPLRGRLWLQYGALVVLLWTLYFLVTHLTFAHAHSHAHTEPPAPAPRQSWTNASTTVLGDKGPMGGTEWTVSALDPCQGQSAFFSARGTMQRDYLREVHHYAFGRAWGLGRDITDYIKSRGLKPTDKFLDFGCGALRNGIWLIKYLDAGNYYGIEHDKLMFEAGRDYELPLNGLQHKRANLYNNLDGQPGLRQFGVKFDKIMAFAVLIHFTTPGLKRTTLNAFIRHLAPGGTIFLSHHLPFSKETLEKDFGLRIARREKQKCRWSQSVNDWYELQLTADPPAEPT